MYRGSSAFIEVCLDKHTQIALGHDLSTSVVHTTVIALFFS